MSTLESVDSHAPGGFGRKSGVISSLRSGGDCDLELISWVQRASS